MNPFKRDGNGLRAAFAIACESEDLAARLRISLNSNSSEGVIVEALADGYLIKKKRQLFFRLILFFVKSTAKSAFGYCIRFFTGTKITRARLTKL